MRPRILFIVIGVGSLGLGIAGGVVAQAFLMPYLASDSKFQHWGFVREWNERATVIREVSEVVIRVDDAAQRVAGRAEAMVVAVESRGAGRVIIGSGFAVYEDGFIITLASTAPQGYETRVYLGDEEEFVLAEVLKREVQKNIALLKIDAKNLQTAGFADDSSLRLGAPVLVVAKNVESGELVTIVNQGSVRTKDKDMVRTNIFDKSTLGGSPLLDLEGRIVGLTIVEASGRLVAIPASILREFSGF